jgi:Ca2+-binding EF-hand superfamily protein
MFGLSRIEWLLLAGAVLLLPALTFAAEPAASLFERLDRNKDGYLSREELASRDALTRNWIAIDRDRDGRISRSEFGLVGIAESKPAPSAAAGATKPEATTPQAAKPE